MQPVLQTIESKDLSVADLLASFYVVPSYQREYVWQSEQVEQLLDDIHDEFTTDGGSESEYFIGSIVVLGTSADTYELIDGQQRMTTLFVILCAIRDHLRAGKHTVPATLLAQISAPSIDADGNERHRYRVELQYEDSRGVLERLGGGGPQAAQGAQEAQSVANILSAYTTAREFLKRQFGDDDGAVRRYYAFLCHRIKLIRVKTASMTHALKVFETINDRGVGLDSMDLLKNLLFMQAKPDQFEKLRDGWKALVDVLYKAREKPLRFLRYYILANHNVERLREDEIYRWFVEHKREAAYERDPLGFAQRLLSAAEAYGRFVQGQNADGTLNRYLDNLRFLSGAARQHLILLMAGRHLDRTAFTELCRHLENLFFAYVITREPTKEFERTFARWTAPLRGVGSLEDLQVFVEKYFVPAKRSLASRFKLAFREMQEDQLQKYRLMYVLAKLTQHVDELAKGDTPTVTSLKTYINSKVHLEHILPQTPSEEVRKAFGANDYDAYVRRLGNLTLLEKSINISAGNNLFAQKRQAYDQSDFLLTRSLGRPIGVGVDTAYQRAAELLERFDSWEPADVERRQGMLGRLAWTVWEMPQIDEEEVSS
jgi:hypothetical protein